MDIEQSSEADTIGPHQLKIGTANVIADFTTMLLISTGATMVGSGFLLSGCGSPALSNERKLLIERRTIEVAGKAASVFGIRQPNGQAGLTLEPGERFAVSVANQAGEATTIHWHGQTPPPAQDGIVDFGVQPISSGGRRDYDFTPRAGTHWMHSHLGLQEQRLMAAPLIVRTTEDVRSDMQEVVVLLHDFTFGDPATILGNIVTASKEPGAAAAMESMNTTQPRTNLTRSPPDSCGCVATQTYSAAPRIYACGDMRRGQSLVVWAVREGREYAAEVDRAFKAI